MGDRTGIEWAEATWNPVTGCDRTSPGCDNCYALTMAGRLKAMGSSRYQNDGDPRTSGPGFALTEHPDALDQPLRWRKPRRIFVNSMSDLFHKDVTDEFIAQVFAVMALAPQHTFQVLTKRPQRMANLLAFESFWDLTHRHVDRLMSEIDTPTPLYPNSITPLPNVWLGTSIESDHYAFRANHLRATPAAVRWISAEPLLGPLPSLDLTGIDWLVVGGESGPKARPMDPDWVFDLRDRTRCVTCDGRGSWPAFTRQVCPGCGATGRGATAFFFKQWGAWSPDGSRIGKTAAGRLLGSRTWDEYPVERTTRETP